MIIILSFSHIHSKLSRDIGDLPAMLLPVGNKKLIEHQVVTFRKVFESESIVTVLPKGYCPTSNEQATFDRLSISVIFADIETEIIEILMQLVNELPQGFNEPIRIQLGNTWLYNIPTDNECLTVSNYLIDYQNNNRSNHNHCNSEEEADLSNEFVQFYNSFAKAWIGYVSFGSSSALLSVIDKVNGSSRGLNNALLNKTSTASITSTNSQYLIYEYFANLVYAYQQRHDALSQIMLTEWHDCNCDNGYFIARASLTTQRSFNTLCIMDGRVTKSSQDNEKIKAEAHWYKNMPEALNPYLPTFISSGFIDKGAKNRQYYYSLEYLQLFPLNELYVHGQSDHSLWKRIFNSVKEVFKINAENKYLENVCINDLEQYSCYLYEKKTLSRLNKYAKDANVSLKQPVFYEGKALGSIEHIARHCIDLTAALPFVPAIMHGDLCFSNLLFDSANNKIKMIDPRGIDANGNMSIYGDQTYDLAKLAHSVIGLYDFIIAGQYTLSESWTSQGYEQTLHFHKDPRRQQIQKEFFNTEFIEGFSTLDIMPAVVLLFLSMLPLHADRPDRQQAMLLNAIRIYKTFVLSHTIQDQKRELTHKKHSQEDYLNSDALVS